MCRPRTLAYPAQNAERSLRVWLLRETDQLGRPRVAHRAIEGLTHGDRIWCAAEEAGELRKGALTTF